MTVSVPIKRELSHFRQVDTWVFDLDNTLYPPHSDLWPKIDARITAYMAAMFGLDGISARALQKHYYRAFGTTLSGLIHEYQVDPQEFLHFVHDIDRSSLDPNPALAAAIEALPGESSSSPTARTPMRWRRRSNWASTICSTIASPSSTAISCRSRIC